MKTLITSVLAAAALMGTVPASAAQPAKPAQQREASIPFVNHGGIRDWQVAGRDTLYVQDAHRNWYRASLMGPCIDLPYAWGIGFDTGPTNRFDRFSNIIVRGQRCPVTSVVAVAGPPTKADRAQG